MFGTISSQSRNLKLFFFLLYSPPLIFLAMIVVLGSQLNIDLGLFTRDATTTAGLPFFVGIVSSIGIMFWTASATICLFSWLILRPHSNEICFATFLLCAGLMTTLLLFDDLFLLHEMLFSKYFGVPEEIVFMGYMGLVAHGIFKFKKHILGTDYTILFSALIFFGLSLTVDFFQHQFQSVIGEMRILLEDGFKLFGIIGWFGYFLRCSFIAIREKMDFFGEFISHR